MRLVDLEDRGAETVSIEEAAKVLGISLGLAYDAVGTGQLPALRLGKRLRVSVRVLARMLDGEDPVST